MPPRRRDTAEPTVKLGGKKYYLAMQGPEPVYSTGTRAIEGQQTDRDEIVIDDWSGGIGGPVMAAATGFVTAAKNRLFTQPAYVAELDVSGTATVDKPFRYSFEAQDSNGRWYKYFVSENHIAKVDIGVDPPVLRRVYDVASTSGFSSTDILARPIKAVHSGNVRWYFPTNNGNRLVYMADPVAVDTGSGSADSFTAITSVTEGAAHFKQLPSGKVVRVNATHSAGTFQDRCEISLLDAGADFETDANWGADFTVANQTDWALALMNIEELILIRKSDDKWYTATVLQDGTIQFRDILPDEISPERFAIGSEVNHEGQVWHGRLYLPTAKHLWRHSLSSAFPVDLSMIHDNWWEGDISIASSGREASIGALAPAGSWLYGSMSNAGSVITRLMVAREPRAGDASPYELVWNSVAAGAGVSGGPNVQCVSPQLNGEGAPRLWIDDGNTGGDDFDLKAIAIGNDGSPAAAGGTFGISGNSGTAFTRDYLFDNNVLVVEARLLVEDAHANLTWKIHLDFDRSGVQQVGSGRTNSGSLFPATPGTNDNGKRLRVRVAVSSDGDHSSTTPSTLREVRLPFYHLPDVSDPVVMVIDVAKTSAKTGRSQAAIRGELKGYRSSRQAWIDPHNASGHLLVHAANQGSPKSVSGMDGQEWMTVQSTLLEYS